MLTKKRMLSGKPRRVSASSASQSTSIAFSNSATALNNNSRTSSTTATTTSATAAVATTTTIGKARNWLQSDFQIGQALGRGKFGHVYSAIENKSRRGVALKVLPKLLCAAPSALLQLRREVQIHSRLHHPNICSFLGYMHDQKHAYLVLEKCERGHLYAELLRVGKFSKNDAVNWSKQLMSALQYCHDRHVAHRDLKPENLLLHGNTLKLADFGWAVHMPGEHNGKRTTLCGSPAYVSPEIVEGTGHGLATDLWSLGVIVYELLHGVPPFQAATEQGIFERIRKCDLVFPEAAVLQHVQIPADADSDSRDLIQGLVTYEPEKRWKISDCLEASFFA